MATKATKVEGLVLTIKGKRVELTIEEAKRLRDELNATLSGIEYVPTYPTYPWYVHPAAPAITWGDGWNGVSSEPFAEITCRN
jgi:hypothetical protein